MLRDIDTAAERDYTNRSDFIRQALLEYLRMPERLTGESDLEAALKILQRRKALGGMKKFMRENKLDERH